jgi:beta-lactamase regulating signal transducer with metallopeptidase domain
MTATVVVQASTSLLTQLVNPAARALALSVVVGIALAAFRVKSTSLRLFAWTAVLYTAIAMPLLQQLLPPLPIPAPAFLRNVVNARPNQVFRAIYERTAEQGSTLLAAEERQSAARVAVAERHQNAAHGASRGASADAEKPRRGERLLLWDSQKAGSTNVRVSSFSLPSDAPLAKAPLVRSSPIRWTEIAAGIYLVVVLIFLARFLIGLAFSRRLLQASQPIDDLRLIQRLAARASAAGLTVIPHAAESDLISVPLTLGALRSTILLPAAWREWDNAQLAAVIAHEVSHVARRDALTQRVSLLHRAIFWFSPLAWWLDRGLANLAEQASDEAALSSGTDRKHYARILLGFFEALQAAPGRVWWQGVSMAKAGQAEQRVERILAWKGSVAMRLQKSIAVVIVAFAVPFVYLAAAARPAQHVPLPGAHLTQDQTPPTSSAPPAPASPETTPPPEPTPELDPALAPAMIRGTIKGGVAGIPTPSLAPVGGIAADVVAPAAPLAPVAPDIAPMDPFPRPDVWSGSQSEASKSSDRRFSYHYGYDDEQRFVIVSGKTDSLTMSGSAEDARHAEKLKKNIPGDFIWFLRDEKSYVIRDQATVDRARKLWEPQEELGKKQEALGKQQEALGKQQEELGARMQKIRVNVPDLNADLEKLKAELKQLSSSGATVEQVGHIQSEIGELQSKIGNIQSHAGDQQGKLGEEMGALGEQQGKLGEQQGELGELQGKLAEQATREMKQLLDEAITKGTAQPEI